MKKFSLLVLTALPFLTMAHSGHGLVQDGPAHYVFSPMHLIGVLAMVAVVVLFYKMYARKKRNA